MIELIIFCNIQAKSRPEKKYEISISASEIGHINSSNFDVFQAFFAGFSLKAWNTSKLLEFKCPISAADLLMSHFFLSCYIARNTVISPNFLVWKFCENA